jgi:uncharacterized membrane protein
MGMETLFLQPSGSQPGFVRVLFFIVVLLYSFFHFLWHTRELHNMALVLKVPGEQLQKISELNPLDFLVKMYVKSGIHFTFGIRGFYFLMPLLLWLFHPSMMLFAFFSIMAFLVKRDLGKANPHFSSVQVASGSKFLAGNYSNLCSLPKTEEDGAAWTDLWRTLCKFGNN